MTTTSATTTTCAWNGSNGGVNEYLDQCYLLTNIDGVGVPPDPTMWNYLDYAQNDYDAEEGVPAGFSGGGGVAPAVVLKGPPPERLCALGDPRHPGAVAGTNARVRSSGGGYDGQNINDPSGLVTETCIRDLMYRFDPRDRSGTRSRFTAQEKKMEARHSHFVKHLQGKAKEAKQALDADQTFVQGLEARTLAFQKTNYLVYHLLQLLGTDAEKDRLRQEWAMATMKSTQTIFSYHRYLRGVADRMSDLLGSTVNNNEMAVKMRTTVRQEFKLNLLNVADDIKADVVKLMVYLVKVEAALEDSKPKQREERHHNNNNKGRGGKNNDKPRGRGKQANKQAKQANNSNNEDGEMWCSFHEMKTHNTADCQAKKREESSGTKRGNAGKGGRDDNKKAKNGNGTGTRKLEEMECYKCHELGHIARDCPSKESGASASGVRVADESN